MRHRSDEREFNNRSNRGARNTNEQAARRWTERDEDRLSSQNQRSSRFQHYNDNRPFAAEDFQEDGDRYERDDYGQFGSYDMQSRTPESYNSQRDYSEHSSGEFGQMAGREHYNDLDQMRPMRGGQRGGSRLRGNDNQDRYGARGNSSEWSPSSGQSQSGGGMERPFYGRQTFNQGPYGLEPAAYASQSSMEGQSSQRGSHTGKGPKGYSRSDERIKEDVCEALSQHAEIDASDIDVEVSNGEVLLKGTVDEKRIKRLAEECVENLSGVKDVTNQLRVGKRQEGQKETQSSQTEHGKPSRTDIKGRAA